AADHAFHVVHGGDVGNADGVGDAAGFHQLDIDDVGGAQADQFDHFHRPEHALVGHYRCMHTLGDVAHAGQVARLDRLLDQLQFDAGIFQRVQRVDGLLGGPALVRIQAQQRTAFDGGVDGLDPFDVHADVLAHLDLQRAEAAIHRADGVGHHLVDVVHADGDVGSDHRIAAAQELVERRVIQLPPKVVQRDFHRRLGAGVFLHRRLHQLGEAIEVGDVLAEQARGDVVADRIDDRAVRVAGDHGRGRRFAITGVAGIGGDHHHDVVDLGDGAQRRLERRLERYAQHAELDVGDFHCRWHRCDSLNVSPRRRKRAYSAARAWGSPMYTILVM